MGLLANKIYLGDCIQRLKEVDRGSVDLVFADPPFNIGYEYDVYDDARSREDYLKWSEQWMRAVSRVLKPTGSFWLAIGDENAAELKLIAQDQADLSCRSWVIWYYTFGVNCVQGFSRSHTHLFHFVKDARHFTFNAENPAVRVLSARQLVYADARANSKGRLPDNTWILRPQDAPPSAFGNMHDTWYFARVAGTFKEREGFHGCQMPEQLLGRIIRVSSNPGELVLDPFGGSGTTLAVAKKLGRQWLGIEFSKEYVKRIKARLNASRVGDALEGPEDALQSAPKTAHGKRRVRFRNGRTSPCLDANTKSGIIDAYRSVAAGNSADFLLCHPELNEHFVEACKKKSLPGDASAWNRLLLRIRKQGDLPRAQRSARRLTFAGMDAYSAASEIAMQLVSLDYDLTLDEILCSPELAGRFDALAREFAEGFSPFEYRWAAVSLRKRAKQAKKLATELFREWGDKRLPPSKAVADCVSARHEKAGVYILSKGDHVLYVGETQNLRSRMEQVLGSQAWRDLGPESLRVLSGVAPQEQCGLQSMLIGKSDPMLNSSLLRPRLDVAV